VGKLASIARRAIGAETVASLAEELRDVRAEERQVLAEADRLKALIPGADSFEAARELATQVAKCEWSATSASARALKLESRLAEARAREQAEALERHRVRRIALYRRLRAAIEDAAAMQAEAITADQEACRELGEQLVRRHFQPIVFRGILLPDLVALWVSETDRVLDPKPATVPATAPRRTPPAAARPASSLQHPIMAAAAGGRELTVGSSGPLHAPKVPDDTAPLEPGEVRVRVLKAGYPGPDGKQSHMGRLIRLRREVAEVAAKNAAVLIIEGGA